MPTVQRDPIGGLTKTPEDSVPAIPMSSVQIYEDLRARIIAREAGYQPGDRLPSQAELADLYSVHRATISRAMLLLAHDGLVRGRGGAGTIVLDRGESAGDHYSVDHF